MRHLECERTEPFLSALENFVKTTLGNAYAISLKNVLFRRRNSLNRKTYDALPDNDNREFFCSELIAKAYKEAGLIMQEQASWAYMPADFSKQGKRLKLEKDAKLSEEVIIRFDEESLLKEREEYEKKMAEGETQPVE